MEQINEINSFKRRIHLYGLSYLTQVFRPILTKEVQVCDKEKVMENYKLTSKQCLWLFKHETTLDVMNIMPLWRKIASKPDLTIIAKQFTKKKEKLFGWFFKPFLVNFYRPNHGKPKTGEERKWMDQENEKKIEMIKRNYLQGGHCLMMPEGTTETDGTVSQIKAGCYDLSFVEQEGSIRKINLIPIGLTYDPFSSKKHWYTKKTRNLVFVHLGKPFQYEKAFDNKKQDMIQHTSRVRDALINCNTITTAQLAGEYIVRRAINEESELTLEQLQRVVSARVEELRNLEGLVFDTALLDERTREKRVAMLYDNLDDYLASDRGVNLARVLLEPQDYAHYKKENRLRYCANRLIQISDRTPPIEAVLKRTRA